MYKKFIFYWLSISAVILLLLVSFHPFILKNYANFFTVNNYSKGADAILILGGSADTRAKKAIELLENGYSNQILITHPSPKIVEYKNVYVSDFDNLKHIIESEKIEFKIIEDLKGGAKSTFDEARDLVNYTKQHKLKRVIIVTDNFHTRRAKYAFDKIFKELNCKTIIEIAGAENQIYTINNWWKTERGLDQYISEGFKYLIYLNRDTDIEGISTE